MKLKINKNIMITKKRIIGNIGEDLACRFLMKQGFDVIGRNYLRKYGEIDVIAMRDKVIHFVEVKTVSRENLGSISHVTDYYRPEDNLHPWKLQRMRRVIQSYLADKNVSDETKWVFDVITVLLDRESREAKINFMENIIL